MTYFHYSPCTDTYATLTREGLTLNYTVRYKTISLEIVLCIENTP